MAPEGVFNSRGFINQDHDFVGVSPLGGLQIESKGILPGRRSLVIEDRVRAHCTVGLQRDLLHVHVHRLS